MLPPSIKGLKKLSNISTDYHLFIIVISSFLYATMNDFDSVVGAFFGFQIKMTITLAICWEFGH